MTTMQAEMRRLSHTLMWRGAGMVALGIGAVVWPEPFLIAAMFTVGVVAALFGIYELTIAASIRAKTSRWWMVLAHGTVCLAFGLVTVGAPRLALGWALAIVALWLLAYAGVMWSGAALVWSMRKVRWALVVWGALDVALAIFVVAYPAATIFSFLFFGAVYAALFGAWQIAGGVWLRRRLSSLLRASGMSEKPRGAVHGSSDRHLGAGARPI